MFTDLNTMYPAFEVKTRTAADIIDVILTALPGIYTAVDLGCGSGIYVRALNDSGVKCFGIDYGIDKMQLMAISLSDIYHKDLTKLVHLQSAYPIADPDLVFCIEVAEHIKKEREANFFDSVVWMANKWIVFTGSDKPHSPGHINPQSNEYWRERITERGTHKYRADLSQTIMDSCKTIIGVPGCLQWFQANLQVFERIENVG